MLINFLIYKGLMLQKVCVAWPSDPYQYDEVNEVILPNVKFKVFFMMK